MIEIAPPGKPQRKLPLRLIPIKHRSIKREYRLKHRALGGILFFLPPFYKKFNFFAKNY